MAPPTPNPVRIGPVEIGKDRPLALSAGPTTLTIEDFRLAFLLIALLPLASALGFLRLSPLDGAEVSGHHQTQPRSA